MTLKGDAKSKRKLNRSLKYDERNFVHFHISSQNYENFHFDELLLSKVYKVLDEQVQRSLMTLKCDTKSEKNDSWFQK